MILSLLYINHQYIHTHRGIMVSQCFKTVFYLQSNSKSYLFKHLPIPFFPSLFQEKSQRLFFNSQASLRYYLFTRKCSYAWKSMFFNELIELCNHHSNLALENFHHPNMFSVPICSQFSLPSPAPSKNQLLSSIQICFF